MPTLLTALDGIGGDFWIRLLYGYPTGLTDSLLRAMRELPRVCHYLDIPIQHSHPDVLRTMQRANTMESVRKLGPRARRAMPDVTLRTTCLVGFPGETDAQFEHLLAYVEQTRFDHLGAFVFSPEAGTAAAGLPDRPPREVAEARRDRLMRLQRRLVDEAMAACIGNETDVLLEMPVEAGSNVWVARSRALAPEVDGDIFVEGVPPGSEPGAFAYIRYTGAQDYDRVARFLRMTAQPKQG